MLRLISTFRSKAITFQTHGKPQDVLNVKEYDLSVRKSQLLLKILAAPVNPSDINIIEGTYPLKPRSYDSVGHIGGQEGVAEVIEVGEDVSGFQTGDWYWPSNVDTWQSFAVAEATHVLKLPDCQGVSAISAATMSVNPPTAYRMLKDFGKLQAGDVVVQNSANSAVGQAVIQIGKAWDLKVVSIIRPRSDATETEQLKQDLHRMGSDLVITEDEVRKPETALLLNDLGPTPKLGLNGVGGKSATNLARLLGNDAHLVTYGGMSREPVTIPTSLFIFKNLTCSGFWLNKWFLQRPIQARIDIYQDLIQLIREGKLLEPMSEQWSLSKLDDKKLKTIGSWSSNQKSLKRILVP